MNPNKHLLDAYGSLAGIQPNQDLLNAYDGDTINKKRLVSKSGFPFDAFEVSKREYSFDNPETEWQDRENYKKQELRFLKQKEALARQGIEDPTDEDVFAKGAEQRDYLQSLVDGGGSLNNTGKQGFYGRNLHTFTNPDGSDYADSLNTPEHNASYYEPENAGYRLQKALGVQPVNDPLEQMADLMSPENAIQRITKAQDKRDKLDRKMGRPTELETLAGQAEQLLGSLASGIHNLGSSIVKTPTAAYTAGKLNQITDEDMAMYQSIKQTEAEGKELTPTQEAFKTKEVKPDGFGLEGLPYKPFENIENAMQAQDFTNAVNDQHAEMADQLVNRSRQKEMQADIGDDFDSAKQSFDIAKKFYDQGDYGEAFSNAIDVITKGGDGVVTAVMDHPMATINTAIESLPGMALAVANLPSAVVVTTGDSIGTNIQKFQEKNGRLPTEEETTKIVGSAVAKGIIENLGDKIVGKALKFNDVKKLSKPEINTLSAVAKARGKPIAQFISGAIAEYAAEGTANALDQYAVKQDASEIDLKEVYESASIGAAAGGLTKTTLETGGDVANKIADIAIVPESVKNLRQLTDVDGTKDRRDIVTNLDSLADHIESDPDNEKLVSEYKRFSDIANGFSKTEQESSIARANSDDPVEYAKGLAGILSLGSQAKPLLDKLPIVNTDTLDFVEKQEKLSEPLPIDGVRGLNEHIRSIGTAIEYDDQKGTEKALERLKRYRDTLITDEHIEAVTAGITAMENIADTTFGQDARPDPIVRAIKEPHLQSTARAIAGVLKNSSDGISDSVLETEAVESSSANPGMSPEETFIHETSHALWKTGVRVKPSTRNKLRKLSVLAQRKLGTDGYKVFGGDPEQAKALYNRVLSDPIEFATYATSNRRYKEALEGIGTEVADLFNSVNNNLGSLFEKGVGNKTIASDLKKLEGFLSTRKEPEFNKPIVSKEVLEPIQDKGSSVAKVVSRIAERLGKTRDNEVYKVLRELQGNTTRTLPWHKLLRQQNVHRMKEQDIKKGVSEFLADKFDDSSPETMQALNNTILKTELHLLSDYDLLDVINNTENHIEQLQDEISHLHPEYAKHYLTQAEGLGRFAATGEIGTDRQMLNAHNIVNLLALEKDADVDTEQAESLVERLASLYALKYTSKDSKARTAQMLDSEGVKELMKIHKQFREESLNGLFDGDKTAMQFGWIKDQVNSNVTVEVAPEKDRAKMKKRGFAYQVRVNTDAFDDQMGLALYTTTVPQEQRQSGLTGKGENAKGTFADNQKSIRTGSGKAVLNNTLDYGRNYAVPIISNGSITGFRYLMNDRTKQKILGANNQAHEVMGDMLASITAKHQRRNMDELIVQQSKEDFDKHFKSDPKRFVRVSPDSHNPKHKELYEMLSKDFKEEVQKVWGSNEFYMQEELLDLVYGYKKLSLTNNLPELIQPIARRLSSYWEKIVALNKKHIVKYTPEVVLGNIGSNVISTSTILGTNPKRVAQLQLEGIKLLEQYNNDKAELIKFKLAGKNTTKLESQIKNNPFDKLFHAGMISGETEDLGNKDTHIKYLHNKSIEKFTDLADPVARYAAYTVMTDDKGMSHEDAVDKAMEMFVEYDSSISPGMQYLDDKGITPFMKYLLRIQRVLLQAFRDKPVNAIASEVALRALDNDYLQSVGSSNLVEKLGPHKIVTPDEVLDNAVSPWHVEQMFKGMKEILN